MLYILMGESAAGKDKIFKLMSENNIAKPVVTATTRPPREREVNGVDYHFKTKDEFKEMIKNNELMEYVSFHTTVNGVDDEWFYGTPASSIDPTIDQVIVVNPKGAKALIAHVDSIIKRDGMDFDYKVILVTAPAEVRTERAKRRGSFDETEWNRRLKSDADDFSQIACLVDVYFDNSKDLSNVELLHKIKNKITCNGKRRRRP